MSTGLATAAAAAGTSILDAMSRPAPPSVVAIYVAPSKGAAMSRLEEVRAVPGRGLEGDRFFGAARGPASGALRASAVTLIEAEALNWLERKHGIRLAPAESRRNLLTRGVDLNALVGREFRVGEVVLRGVALCEPCLHLQRSTRAGVLRALVHRGGLRADLVGEGMIRSGDPVRTAKCRR